MTAKSAESEKFIAEAEAYKARADHYRSLARKDLALARDAELDLERNKEKRADELAQDRYFHRYPFSTQVDSNSVKALIDALTKWERQADKPLDVELVINSPGGEVFAGFALIDYLSDFRSRGNKVTTIGLGMVASMAGPIHQCGDVRILGASAFYLIHEAQFHAFGSFGNVMDEVKLVEMAQDRILDILSERSNLTRSQLKRRWHRKDWWLGAKDCLKYGFVDEVR